MDRALVTPDLLAWARERGGIGAEDLAKKLNVKAEAVFDWEAGERQPTFRQAQRFAQALHVPLGYLYLPEPPIQELPIPDFRTIPGRPPREPSPDLLDLLNGVLGKQQWFREYRESEGFEELPFVGRFSPSDPEDQVAGDIRDVIDVIGARQRGSNWDDFLRELTRNVDQSGIMVMRSGVVGNNNRRPLDVEEFRGFSVSDYFAPLIFINGRDSKGAQIFTLVHELAHIWIGQGGISDPDYSLSFEQQDNAIERFCNRVSAETLVPSHDFAARWRADSSSWEARLDRLTNHYKVSTIVVLRQAYDLDFMPRASYQELYDRLVQRSGKVESDGESGGNFQYTLTARNGAAFTEAVISSTAEGSLLSRDAADMLGVKVKTLPAIAEHLFGSPLSLG